MYALKKITVTNDGRCVEEVHVLGSMYRLEFHPQDPKQAASVEYFRRGNTPNISIAKSDEAYITTLTGDTVRCICRGDASARQALMRGLA
ncbi:hypothetical protein ACOGYQ_000180 [Edwardsiella piscicida]|uniref:hypothetical protein n=1 Tax=Edwardsiella piscicida TaxID=1263550 RepID=UPI0002C119D8|nr:hypothetical protein [Edwardsiella piscicida]AGH74044.1 hypothetical protein ETAC_09615 [Edwardsiella piscicida C07-087]EKS7783462.1 hypothetical protein [Edwardsiella piscicida]UCQ33288.1 hypothetical protein DCF34_09765 [Edwardsiella piscicida]